MGQPELASDQNKLAQILATEWAQILQKKQQRANVDENANVVDITQNGEAAANGLMQHDAQQIDNAETKNEVQVNGNNVQQVAPVALSPSITDW